uniref:Uncharacterized protein LOC113798363 n=1 Tax=Dermatophagoides pteronyssinus TaxID=6956 RepID=A0A6P6YII3_DERPT|nr:uncharacterized protein LOC113798363 [Dermatophagoides pteronyssinus]
MFSNQIKFLNLFILLSSLIIIDQSWCQQYSVPPGMTRIRNKHAYMADKGLMVQFAQDCIQKRYSNLPNSRPSSHSMETLIDYIERLEDWLSNTTDPILSKFKNPDDIARLILHRFHLDDIDFGEFEYSPNVQKRSEIDTKILGTSNLVEMDYYFPDSIYNQEELCTMLYMFSHIFLNTTNNGQMNNRYRRGVYVFNQQNDNSVMTGNNFAQNNQYPIQEKGVVTFRQNINEAIAPAKVLIGILSGLTKNPVTNGKDIAPSLTVDVSFIDPFLATTLANMPGTAVFYQSQTNQKFDEKLIFGVNGEWIDGTCCKHYAIKDSIASLEKLRFSNRGSLAQVRGALDGYVIGKHLRKFDSTRMRLSNILRSYYSVPHSRSGKNQDLGISYCDRGNEKPQQNDLSNEINTYSIIYSALQDMQEMNVQANSFASVLDKASQTQTDICRTRPTTLDQNAPCETPSDLIFVIDPKQENFNKTALIVDDIVTKINKIGRYAGTVSVFVNSNSNKNLVQLPSGPGGWPLSALIFNSTNIGLVSCSFRQDNLMFSAQNSFGKFFKELNQTISNYRYWNGKRKSLNDQASINVIIIDYDTLKLPTDSKELDDYNWYKDSLKYDNRDVRYLVISNDQKNFIDILNDKTKDMVGPTQTQIGMNFDKSICENPAQIIYDKCYEKPSQNSIMEKYISPGYKQQWAMYPEYFLKSYDIEFKVRAVDGAIRYCFDREFPPRERNEYCKDLAAGSEETIRWSNPCKDRNVRSCDPFYFTLWGKERSSSLPCKEIACQSMDQIKFQIIHTGISCSSSMKLVSMFLLQIVCLLFVYQRFNNFA